MNMSIKELLDNEFLHDKEIHALNSLLSGEISALEAYNLAIQKIKDQDLVSTLERCRDSHALKMLCLMGRMEELGHSPPKSAGWWGTMVSLVEGAATMLSDKIAINILTAGEEFGFEQYEHHMKDLDSKSYALVKTELLPAQGRTLQTMQLLCVWLRSEEKSNEHQ